MIVADTSALFAAMFNEPEGRVCRDILLSGEPIFISAGTMVELFIVTHTPAKSAIRDEFMGILSFEIVEVTAAFAEAAGRNYCKWGKGIHPAKLNMGDIYAYTLAEQFDAPLLYIGDDFSQTDIASALDRNRD